MAPWWDDDIDWETFEWILRKMARLYKMPIDTMRTMLFVTFNQILGTWR